MMRIKAHQLRKLKAKASEPKPSKMFNKKVYTCASCYLVTSKRKKDETWVCACCVQNIGCICFDSIKEYNGFKKFFKVFGKKIKKLTLHKRYVLSEAIYITPPPARNIYTGKRKNKADILLYPTLSYRCDWEVVWENGRVTVYDVKPIDRKTKKPRTTPEFRRKQDIMSRFLGLQVQVIA